MSAPNLDALTRAVMSALMGTRDDETEFEAVAAQIASEGVVLVELQGPMPKFTRRPCEGCEGEDEYCLPCMEAEDHSHDEPEYLTLRVTIEARS